MCTSTKHLDYNILASMVVNSGKRDMEAIYAKCCKLKGLVYITFTKMTHSANTNFRLLFRNMGIKNFYVINTI